jgi:hypothetical protein
MTTVGMDGKPLILDPGTVALTLPLVHGVRAFVDDEECMIAFGHHHPRRVVAVFHALYRRDYQRWCPRPRLHPRWGESLCGGWQWRPSIPASPLHWSTGGGG